jgi:hypothetical protein
MNIPSVCRIASIGPNNAMILPHYANPMPDGIFGKDRVISIAEAKIADPYRKEPVQSILSA